MARMARKKLPRIGRPPVANPKFPGRPNAGSQVLRLLLQYGDHARLGERFHRASVIADLTGVDRALVGRWSRGERKPKAPQRAILQERLGIDWLAWEQKPRQARLREEDVIRGVKLGGRSRAA
jgi:transcriptional regulator with XRE-family HTH domain